MRGRARGLASPPLLADALVVAIVQLYLTCVLPITGTGMAAARTLTTIVSTKGQIILPKAIRRHRRWEAGTRLVVEDTHEGVLLKAAPLFAPKRPQEVFGSLGHAGRPRTLQEMEAGISAEARRRHARNRY
jgi:AbrB family looped-hinge helix DNA binding protein